VEESYYFLVGWSKLKGRGAEFGLFKVEAGVHAFPVVCRNLAEPIGAGFAAFLKGSSVQSGR
jgi:hypothetical protein